MRERPTLAIAPSKAPILFDTDPYEESVERESKRYTPSIIVTLR